jgi:CBS domain-containing protein
MNSAIERLLSLRVADVMTKNVIRVSANQTMAEAAETFTERQISGAPVVDEHGRCVGVLSASDFVTREHKRGDTGAATPSRGRSHRLVQQAPEGPYTIEETINDLVSSHMSPTVQTIAEDATLLTAAREMCALHIHRLPVVDHHGYTIGVVTSLDIVAALVNVIEE